MWYTQHNEKQNIEQLFMFKIGFHKVSTFKRRNDFSVYQVANRFHSMGMIETITLIKICMPVKSMKCPWIVVGISIEKSTRSR